MKGREGDEKGRRAGEAERTLEEEMEIEAVCVCVYAPVFAGGRTSKTQQSKGCFGFSLFSSTKAPLTLTPPPLPSDYSSVSPQRQPGLLDSVGHY